DRAFVAAAAAASLIQASHAIYYGFSALQWQAAGLDGGAIGALWALAVGAEIALVRISRPPAPAPTHPPIPRARGPGGSLERDGVRSAAGAAGAVAMPACTVVRRHPSRRARLRGARGAGRARRDRPGLSRRRARPGDGRGHGTIGRAVCPLGRPRLWRH